MPEQLPADEPDPTDAPDETPTSVRDNWWWTPAFAMVAGVVVVVFQYGSIRSGGVWLNWLVAGIGAVLAGYGLVRLVRDYPR